MNKKILWFSSVFVLIVLLFVIFRETNKSQKPNIVFILIDALRKDHLSCYGYERKTSPYIDTLAKDGLLLENTIAQAPWTGSSVASMFTSKYPSQLGIGVVEPPSKMKQLSPSSVTALDEKSVTLAETLKEMGYETIAISGNTFVSDRFGMLQGFEKKEICKHETLADRIINIAMNYIKIHSDSSFEEKQKPFFMYIHFMDLHAPLNPPHPYDNIYPTLDSAPHIQTHSNWGFWKWGKRLDSDKFKIFKSHRFALYDGCLLFIDSQIRRLIDFLKSKELYENTIIVIGADHGEEFWEHAHLEKQIQNDSREYYGIGHGHSLFRELLDVPLIFHGKDIPKGRIEHLVRNIDITPTLLSRVGAKKHTENMEGVDIIKNMKKNRLKDIFAFSEDVIYGYEMKSLQNMQYKYIRCRNNEFLFDKENDPLETMDISSTQPNVVRQFRIILDEVTKQFKPNNKKPVSLDEKTIKQLRSLGYVK